MANASGLRVLIRLAERTPAKVTPKRIGSGFAKARKERGAALWSRFTVHYAPKHGS
jgi:hypothetical protein